jgi:hypothetical protein
MVSEGMGGKSILINKLSSIGNNVLSLPSPSSLLNRTLLKEMREQMESG